MPMQKHIDLDPSVDRLRKIFPDADIGVTHLQVVGANGKFPGTEITFLIDIGQPDRYAASFFISNKELCQTRSNAALAIIVAQRSDAAVRCLLYQTGRRE